MAIITTSARNQIRALHGEWLGDLAVSVQFRRGGDTVAAQDVRIVGASGDRDSAQGAIEASRGDVLVIGGPTLDVRAEDRFTHDGHIYEVVFVRPDKLVKTTADAVLRQ